MDPVGGTHGICMLLEPDPSGVIRLLSLLRAHWLQTGTLREEGVDPCSNLGPPGPLLLRPSHGWFLLMSPGSVQLWLTQHAVSVQREVALAISTRVSSGFPFQCCSPRRAEPRRVLLCAARTKHRLTSFNFKQILDFLRVQTFD